MQDEDTDTHMVPSQRQATAKALLSSQANPASLWAILGPRKQGQPCPLQTTWETGCDISPLETPPKKQNPYLPRMKEDGQNNFTFLKVGINAFFI